MKVNNDQKNILCLRCTLSLWKDSYVSTTIPMPSKICLRCLSTLKTKKIQYGVNVDFDFATNSEQRYADKFNISQTSITSNACRYDSLDPRLNPILGRKTRLHLL